MAALKRCHCGAAAEIENAFGAFRIRCTMGCTDVYPTAEDAARAWNGERRIDHGDRDGPEWQ